MPLSRPRVLSPRPTPAPSVTIGTHRTPSTTCAVLSSGLEFKVITPTRSLLERREPDQRGQDLSKQLARLPHLTRGSAIPSATGASGAPWRANRSGRWLAFVARLERERLTAPFGLADAHRDALIAVAGQRPLQPPVERLADLHECVGTLLFADAMHEQHADVRRLPRFRIRDVIHGGVRISESTRWRVADRALVGVPGLRAQPRPLAAFFGA
jgi:hypothetical protein